MSSFRKVLEGRLRQKAREGLDFAGVVDALEALKAGTKPQLVQAIQDANTDRIGRLVLKAVGDYLDSSAGTAADEALSDGVMTEKELSKLFGGDK